VLALLAAGALAAAPADEGVLWSQGFEDRLPGQAPAGWGGTWGKSGDDLLIVSNLRAVGGRQALLLDRTGGNTEMWGVAAVFPDTEVGWLRFSFAFLVQGAGNDARFSFEIRERLPSGRRVAGLGFAASRVQITPMSAAGTYMDPQRASLGAFEKDAWHRVELWLPTSGAAERRVLARLSRYAGQGAWEAAGGVVQVPGTPPAAGASYGQFMLVMAPGARGYKLFLDDLQAAAVTVAPEASP
jgi:hypothetical protein